jgi:hypothetical protein
MKHYNFLEEFRIDIIGNKKNIKRIYKLGKVGVSTGLSLYGSAQTAVHAIVSLKINELTKMISHVDTRQEVEKILLDIGYIKDQNGNKEVRIDRINYVLSKSVVGPCLQIVKNETDPDWKRHVIKHLKLCRNSKAIYSAATGIGTGLAIKSLITGLRK